MFQNIPSGFVTVCELENCLFIVDLPIDSIVIFHSYVSLQEAIQEIEGPSYLWFIPKGYENTPLKSKGYQLQLHSKGYNPLLSKITYEIWQETQVHKPSKVTKTLACPKIIKSGPRKICLVAHPT